MTTSTSTFLGLLNQTPNDRAILFENQVLSHDEVNHLSGILAQNLINLGISKGHRVAVRIEQGPNLIVAILGVSKAGAAFVPLDTNIPIDRVKYMIADSQASLCIGDEKIPNVTTSSVTELLKEDKSQKLPVLNASDPSYVIYTSGTTGKPKGVLVSHGAIYNYLQFAQDTYLKPERKEVIALITSPSVDMTLTSLLLPMISGGCLAIYNAGSNLQNLVAALNDPQVTLLKCTPTHLSLMSKENSGTSQIKTLIVGGEALPNPEVLRIEKLLPNVRVYNEYGPTEATVGCTVQLFDHSKDQSAYVSIGLAIPGVQLVVVDQDYNPVKKGEKGELLIGGACLAEGYLNNEEATLTRFIQLDGVRYYKSGDVVQEKEGLLYYLGRQDDQVKVQGYRVEPSEISKVLLTNPAIDNAVVKKEGHQLVAYLKADQVDLESLISFLSSRLPAWMIPSRFHVSSLWTVRTNGKLDFESMKEQAKILESTYLEDTYETLNLTDEIRRLIISNSRIKHISGGTNLFDAGLESIQLVNLIVDLEEQYDCHIGMGPIVSQPTLESIVAAVQTSRHQPVFGRFNDHSNQMPVYCFPAAIGGPMAFRGLIESDETRPYRTLEDPSRFSDPLNSYAAAIEAEGEFPCIFIGYSGGGNLSFEVCKILESHGRKVAAIIMLDAFRKRYIPDSMPEDILVMKEEAMLQLGESASPGAVADLRRYYDLVNFELHDYEGSVATDVYLITSENREVFGDRKVQGLPFFHAWANCTSSHFEEIRGSGNHEDMLRGPALNVNRKIIQDIINSYSNS